VFGSLQRSRSSLLTRSLPFLLPPVGFYPPPLLFCLTLALWARILLSTPALRSGALASRSPPLRLCVIFPGFLPMFSVSPVSFPFLVSLCFTPDLCAPLWLSWCQTRARFFLSHGYASVTLPSPPRCALRNLSFLPLFPMVFPQSSAW